MKLLYAGSFDPLTHGHIDIIARAKFFSHVHIGIAHNSTKSSLFTPLERQELIKHHFQGIVSSIFVLPEKQYTGEWAYKNGMFLLRGIRGTKDLEEETSLAAFNRSEFGVETIFLPCDEMYTHVSSSAVKAIMSCDGWERRLGQYIPRNVVEALTKKRGLT